MATISPLQADIDRFIKQTKNLLVDQIPFATAIALNATAKKTNDKIKREMGQHIDQPTPWTKNSTRVSTWATKQDQRAKLGFKDTTTKKGTPASQYLRPTVFGGSRDFKKFGRALQSKGFMPSGMFVVPGKGAPKDRFGNVPASVYRGVLTALNKPVNFTKSGKIRKTKAAKYFLMRKAGKPFAIGINAGKGSARIIFYYVSSTRYKITFDFYKLTRADSLAIFPDELKRGYRQAIKTAKPR